MTMTPRQFSFLRIFKFRFTDVFVFGLRIVRFQTNGQ